MRNRSHCFLADIEAYIESRNEHLGSAVREEEADLLRLGCPRLCMRLSREVQNGTSMTSA